ncbi:MAG: plasmid stability protein [Anaerolineae bacterium]|nr:plasmid stability protein [Anaerolineae bacterium]
MSGLFIEDFPDDLYKRLEERATQHKRTLSEEALHILEMALVKEAQAHPLPEPLQGKFLLTDEWIDYAKREGRE